MLMPAQEQAPCSKRTPSPPPPHPPTHPPDALLGLLRAPEPLLRRLRWVDLSHNTLGTLGEALDELTCAPFFFLTPLEHLDLLHTGRCVCVGGGRGGRGGHLRAGTQSAWGVRAGRGTCEPAGGLGPTASPTWLP